jgi:hypothetical protein
MVKIQWLDLPPQLGQHLFDRAKLEAGTRGAEWARFRLSEGCELARSDIIA